MSEQEIRKIAQEEARQLMQKNYVSGTPFVAPHRHNKVDNIQILEQDLILNLGTGGTVTFARNATYTFNLLYRPRVIMFNGRAVNNTTTYTTQSSIIQGSTSAFLTSAYGGSTGNFDVVFSDGEQRSVTFTSGSITITWSGGLNSTVSNVLTASSGTVISIVNGNAYIKNSWSLQPGGKSAVIESTQPPYLPYPLQGTPYYLQGCSYMTIDTSSLTKATVGVSGQYLVYVKDSSGTVQASLQVTPSTNNINNLEMVVTVGNGWNILGEFIIY